MSNRSRFLALPALLLLLLAVSPFGCDDNDDASSDSESTDDDTAAADDDNDDSESPDDLLVAGAASGYLQVPIGVSFGGFAVRPGFKSPYSQLLGGSRGYLDRPNVKAVALQRGERRIVLAKVAMMGVTESLRTQVVNLVAEQTGVDLDRALILVANHSHSGPGRFLPVPDLMGLVGVDVYSQEIVNRLAESIAAVVVEAIDAAEPARIGFGYREPFDPHHFLTGDRRCYNGPGDFKEDRLWVGKIETAAGETMAVLVGMAMHGVVFGYGSFDLTGDAPDGVERAIEEAYDHPVTAVFIQGSAGDVVPQMQGPLGHRRWQIIEWIGAQTAKAVMQLERNIVTDDQPELRIVTRRTLADRETLGYQPGEFGYLDRNGQFVEYERGAMECGVLASKAHGSIADCDDPTTGLVDGHLGCLLNLDLPIVDGYVEQFRQSALAVAQIGDQYFFTAPGEITSHLAMDTRRELSATLGVPSENINTIGYANNYIFYILQDWDWFQGGGETEGSLFGWRYGPWMTSALNNLAGYLRADAQPPDDDPAPHLFQRTNQPVTAEKSENLALVETQPSPILPRFSNVYFAWHGGHPGLDFFTVTLQRLQNGVFVDVPRANGRPYDDKGWEMAVHLSPHPNYRKEEQRDSRDFLYDLEWETSMDDPTGTLRFKVEGRAKTGQGIERYQVFSDPFHLQAVDCIMIEQPTAELVDGSLRIVAVAAYPPDPAGARRIRSLLAGGNRPAIVVGGRATAVVADGNGERREVELVDHQGESALLGELALDGLTGALTITIAAGAFDDGFGNTNGQAAEPLVFQP